MGYQRKDPGEDQDTGDDRKHYSLGSHSASFRFRDRSGLIF
jgi:hypothetical protein